MKLQRIIKSMFWMPVLVIAFSCNNEDMSEVTQDLWLRHKGADMPIWVRGNIASGKMILFLHGGPGDCAMCYRYYLKPIEEEYAVAYWDQRVSGASSGNVNPNTLTYAQFLEDTELVVKLLKEQYPTTSIYLVGHSFGVELGWQYLTKGNNQENVDGFIAVNGTFSSYRWIDSMRDWVINAATQKNDAKVLAFTAENEVDPSDILNYPWEDLYRHMYDLKGNPVSLYSDGKFVIDYALNSPNLLFAQFTHGKHFDEMVNTDALTFERGDQLGSIQVPIGLFWGKKDGVVPYQVGIETFDLLTNTYREVVTFDESWHEPFITEQHKFVENVIRFVGEN